MFEDSERKHAFPGFLLCAWCCQMSDTRDLTSYRQQPRCGYVRAQMSGEAQSSEVSNTEGGGVSDSRQEEARTRISPLRPSPHPAGTETCARVNSFHLLPTPHNPGQRQRGRTQRTISLSISFTFLATITSLNLPNNPGGRYCEHSHSANEETHVQGRSHWLASPESGEAAW